MPKSDQRLISLYHMADEKSAFDHKDKIIHGSFVTFQNLQVDCIATMLVDKTKEDFLT